MLVLFYMEPYVEIVFSYNIHKSEGLQITCFFRWIFLLNAGGFTFSVTPMPAIIKNITAPAIGPTYYLSAELLETRYLFTVRLSSPVMVAVEAIVPSRLYIAPIYLLMSSSAVMRQLLKKSS